MYVFFHGQILVFLNISKFQPPPHNTSPCIYYILVGRSVILTIYMKKQVVYYMR